MTTPELTVEQLTLRDFFAAHALMGLSGLYPQGDQSFKEVIAPMAYEIADAMLAQRTKEEQS